MNGYLKSFSKQIKTLQDVYYQLIRPVEERASLQDWWVFGGGTALSMFYFNHRKSFDIDIFVTERQIFDFLDPKWFVDESELFDSADYRFDSSSGHLALKTRDSIKVDFLVIESVINPPLKNTLLDIGFDFYVESIEDIIAKKIRWRKEDNLARDIFDLGLAISKDERILQNLIDSRFIGFDDLKKLSQTLEKLDIKKYQLEIKKIEPEARFIEIANSAHFIIQENIKIIQQSAH
jgi:predicted nucleotidyltransferase component of viral defense system